MRRPTLGSAAVLVFSGRDGGLPAKAEADLDRFLADAGVGALVASRETLLCAVVDARDGLDPVAELGNLRAEPCALDIDVES